MTFSPVYALHRLTFQQLRSSNEVGDRPWSEIKNALQKLTATVTEKVMVLRPYLAGMSLAIALMSIACASIFVVIASESLSPGAIAFNRLLISGLVFGGWYYTTSAQQSSWLTDDPAERSI
ncbi:MAG: hypothetical protein VKL39_13280, partial [Leptolyngbyaceae bacterium]|nr:hypothetical protein [Leptolyngbyaceae bacterium]